MRKIGATLLSTMLILTVIIIAAAPDDVESSGTEYPFFSDGDGSQEDPYQISNVLELAGIGLTASTYYIIVNDIDASATSSWNGGEGFSPIGGYYNPFMGHLDGQGYEISNLHINRPSTDYIGLFGVIWNQGSVANVGLIDCDITGNGRVGSLAGYSSAPVRRCYSTGDVTAQDNYAGGLIGEIQSSVFDCYSSCTVFGPDNVGGFVGFNGGGGNIQRCFSTGSVVGDQRVGGFTGYNYNAMKDCYSTGSVSGTDNVGGLIGYIYNYGSPAYITNCYAVGLVSGFTNVGGLIGSNGKNGVVTNCFWDNITTGQITSALGTGRNTTEMHNDSMFISAGWDYEIIWMQKNNSGYPYLMGFYVPEILTISITNATEDDPYLCTIDVRYFKTLLFNNAPITFNITSTSQKLSIDSEGNLSALFLNEDVGEHWVNVTAESGYNTSWRNYTFTVNNTNDAPYITSTNNETAVEDEAYTEKYDAVDIDPTMDVMVWNFSSSADWLEFNRSSLWLNGTPENDDVGSYWVNITVEDGNGGMDFTNFTIFVSNVNDNPVIETADIKKGTEGEQYLVVYTATDVDPTNDILEWELSTDADWLSMNSSTGILTGMPGDLDIGDFRVNVSVSDGRMGLDYSNFTLTISNVNDPPVITTTPVTETAEDEIYIINLTAMDIDPHENLVWNLSSGPSWLSINATQLTGIPDNDEVGYHWIEVSVYDSAMASDKLSFMLTVTNINDAPEWSTLLEDLTIEENTAFSLWGDAYDVDGDDLTHGASTTPASSPTSMPQGGVRWAEGLPAGIYTMNYTVTDGIETINQYLTINVTIRPEDPNQTDPNATTPDTDTDGDGIPDWWEEFYGLDPEDPTDASGDLDGDNLTNMEEFNGKTSPVTDNTIPAADDDDDDDTDPDDDDSQDPAEENDWELNNLAIMLIIILILVIMLFIVLRNRDRNDTGSIEE